MTLPGLKQWRRTQQRINEHPFLPRLPRPISWWLGYRARPQTPPKSAVRLLSILLSTMGAMLANLAVVNHAPLFKNHYHDSSLVPSFAASCILIYGALEAPFSQPRNLVLGHFLSGLIGVCITKLFMTNSHNEQHLWLAGALSVACASVAMDITGTVHPPAGATALLPCVNTEMRHLGWDYLPILLIQCCLFLGVALFCDNIVLRYPKYWLWPTPPAPAALPAPAAAAVTVPSSSVSAVSRKSLDNISVSARGIEFPAEITLNNEEREVLEQLQRRLIATAK